MNRLNDAFRAMRRAGLIARQNYLCCSSCAGAQIAVDIENKIDKDPKAKDKIAGTCFYHRQDAAALGRRGNDAIMMLRYGNLDTQKHGMVGNTTEEVGRIVCQALRESGIGFEWDGDPSKCIEISVADAMAKALPKSAPVAQLPRRTSPRQIASQLARQQATLDAAGDVLTKIAEVNDARS